LNATLIIELVRTTDEMFKDGQNLHNFVAISFPNNLIKVLDPYLVSRDAKVVIEDGNNENLIPSVEEWSVSLFKIGICLFNGIIERKIEYCRC
jgi:hypothetical protein